MSELTAGHGAGDISQQAAMMPSGDPGAPSKGVEGMFCEGRTKTPASGGCS